MAKRTPALDSALNQVADIPHIDEDSTRRSLHAKRTELRMRLQGLVARQGKIEQRINLRVTSRGSSVQRLLENPKAEVDQSDDLLEEHKKVVSDVSNHVKLPPL